jgi:hypothetical protein
MSKIIVDQVATNGGDTFTFPAADGTIAKQPLVTDASGGLSFNTTSPLPPIADGTAGKAVVTDGSGQLEFSANVMPAADGTVGQYLSTDGSGQMEFIDPPPIPSNLPEDSIHSIGMLMSSSARENIYSTGEWSSSGAWTTYYNSFSAANSIIQAANMALGDGYPNATSGNKYHSGDHGDTHHRKKLFAKNKRMGHWYRDYYYYDNVTGNYAGTTWSMLPIRNSSANDIDITLYWETSCWNDNYGGSGMAVYTPTGGTGNYAGVTGGSWTTLSNNSSQSVAGTHNNSVTVPAGKTVIVMMSSHHYYQTTYRFKDTHSYYNLHTSFSNANINCDLRMLETLFTARTPSATNSNDYTWELYPACAALFSDR